MSCCPTIDTGSLQAIPIVYELPLTNLVEVGGVLTRSGGTPGTGDAFANGENWVEGTGCAYWQWTITNPIESNQIIYLVYPEDGSVGGYGWGYTNELVNFRRTRFENGSGFFPIFFHNSTLGFNHFAILYNNGNITLYETSESALTAPGWILPQSYAFSGLPTTTRWRLRVYVKPAAIDGQSAPVIEAIGASGDVCGAANWPLPTMQWSATGEITSDIKRGGVETARFDAGAGNAWWLLPQLSDSGVELRDKVIKAVRATAKVTNANFKVYGYGATEELDIASMIAGTNSRTGAVAIPDTTGVESTRRFQVNVPGSALHTTRLEGEWDGEGIKDRIDEVEYEIAEQGVRR